MCPTVGRKSFSTVGGRGRGVDVILYAHSTPGANSERSESSEPSESRFRGLGYRYLLCPQPLVLGHLVAGGAPEASRLFMTDLQHPGGAGGGLVTPVEKVQGVQASKQGGRQESKEARNRGAKGSRPPRMEPDRPMANAHWAQRTSQGGQSRAKWPLQCHRRCRRVLGPRIHGVPNTPIMRT